MSSRTSCGLASSGRNHRRERADLSLESRFDLAYNAAHALALAALRAKAHRKRNLAEYEGEMEVDEQLVAAMVRVAREVEQRVTRLIDGMSGHPT